MDASRMPRGRRRWLVAAGTVVAALALAAAAMTPADATTPAPAGSAATDRGHTSPQTITGQLVSAGRPLARTDVALYQAASRGAAPVLAQARSDRDGRFTLRYRPGSPSATLYVVAGGGHGAQLASALGSAPAPGRIVVNDRTTVAAGYALAQFIRGTTIVDNAPGTANGAAMTRDLVDPRTGGLSRVLTTAPNGSQTTTVRTFNSLSNLVAACVRDGAACRDLLQLATPAGGARPEGTLQALADIAANPAHNAAALYDLSREFGTPYRPALAPNPAVTSWVLALRFYGDGHTLNGPGNSAIDARGNVWVTSNYQYSRDPLAEVCGSDMIFKFTPTGQYASGSPVTGGGLSGAGYGITLDPHGHVWVGNFGFAAKYCTTLPPHNSVSEFAPSGRPLSPSVPAGMTGGGYQRGSIDWPQGTVSDRDGNIWVANCANDSVTRIPHGDASRAQSIPLRGVGQPFDIAFNTHGQAFVDGNADNSVAMLNPDGSLARTVITGGGLNKPLGIAADSAGNIWVANSAHVLIPCSKGAIKQVGLPSVTLIHSDGTIAPRPFIGGGISEPWGIAVDGDDHVWVANFKGQRVSELCGIRTDLCPPGTRLGQAISPRGGYAFDGLARNTSVQIDPTGNVWITNNWKLDPVPSRNPGGYEMVVYIGAAAPVRTPLIGPPQSIWDAPMR